MVTPLDSTVMSSHTILTLVLSIIKQLYQNKTEKKVAVWL